MGSCPPVARSFSPARLHAVGAGLARLHYVEREDPGDGHPGPRRATPPPGAGLHHALNQATGPRAAGRQPEATPARSNNHPGQGPALQINAKTLRQRLTNFLLRWFPRKRLVKYCTKRFRGNALDVAASAIAIQIDALPAAEADVRGSLGTAAEACSAGRGRSRLAGTPCIRQNGRPQVRRGRELPWFPS